MKHFIIFFCVLFSLALLSCGFLPSSIDVPERFGDGIGPWEEQGPVHFCFGNTLIGRPRIANPQPCETKEECSIGLICLEGLCQSPQLEPSGICIPPEITPQSCTDSSQCHGREACLCGQCIVQHCTTHSDCIDGKACNFAERQCVTPCATESDCHFGETCRNRICYNNECQQDTDCFEGEFCSRSNKCVIQTCSPTVPSQTCLQGKTCVIQKEPRHLLEPTFLPNDDSSKLTMWMEMSAADDAHYRSIYRAQSDNGIIYAIHPLTPVLDNNGNTHAPSIIKNDDTFMLYYEYDGSEIRSATSIDGISFAQDTVAIEAPPNETVHAPSALLLPSNNVLVYYHLSNGHRIDMARGQFGNILVTEGTALTKHSITVSRQDSVVFWDPIQKITSPYALLAPNNETIKLWFSAFGKESDTAKQLGNDYEIPENFSVGYAQGTIINPINFTPWPWNPVFDSISLFLTHQSETGAAIIRDSRYELAPYLLYYTKTNSIDGSIRSLHVAINGTLP